MLTGLSARSFGRFAYYVTQIAAGRVERGLPTALRRCGYRTFSIYPALGAFMSARNFQTTTGMQKFLDQDALGTHRSEPDRFYYDVALRMIERERGRGPMFLFVYLAANHYPWSDRWRPDLLPDWKNLGNAPEVDEYLRRQSMSSRDYAALLERLKRDYPDESFLLVRYGDHQPEFASFILDPSLDETAINRRLHSLRPALFHDLLRDRHDQLQTRKSCLGARHARGPLSSSGHPGGGRAAARSIVCRAKANSRTLQGAVLCLRRRGGSAAFQSAVDRCRLDQRALMAKALSWHSRAAKLSTVLPMAQ